MQPLRIPRIHVLFALVTILFGTTSCQSGTGHSDVVIEPIEIDSVEVITSDAPSPVSVHVTGRVGDSCWALCPVEQQRSGDRITISITRTLLQNGICQELLQLYDEVIPLQGKFPRGTYEVTINNVKRSFSVP